MQRTVASLLSLVIRFTYLRYLLLEAFCSNTENICRLGSSVGIATDYGLEGGDEIFGPSRRALGPTQPPVKWVPVLSRG